MKVNSTATNEIAALQSSNQHCLYLSVTIGKHLEVSPREGLQQQIDLAEIALATITKLIAQGLEMGMQVNLGQAPHTGTWVTNNCSIYQSPWRAFSVRKRLAT